MKKKPKPEDKSGLFFDCEYIYFTRGKRWVLKYLDAIESRPKLGLNIELTNQAIKYRKKLREYFESL